MLQNPGGIVNLIFTFLFGTHTHFHISNSYDVHVWPLPPYVPPYMLCRLQ